MAGNAAVRRQALRRMYEQWGVPEALLCDVATTSSKSLRKLIKSEQWRGNHSLACLQVKLAKELDKRIKRLSACRDDEKSAETVTRTFAPLAKVLETLAAVSNKMAATKKLGEQDKVEQSAVVDTAEQRSNLDKQLAALFEKIETQR